MNSAKIRLDAVSEPQLAQQQAKWIPGNSCAKVVPISAGGLLVNNGVNLFDGSASMEEALAQLRLRLLDLTARNRLLNFKHTAGKALQVVPGQLGPKFLRLVGPTAGKITILAVPDPNRDDWIERNGRMAKPDAKEFAQTRGILTDFEHVGAGTESSTAQALHYAEDLGKHLRKIDREAHLAIEETGANMLFLVFGYLEFQDSKDDERKLLAPLVSVPVRIEKSQDAQRTIFRVAYTGEEVEENLSLREKLQRDYQLILPEFPDDDDGIDDYLAAVEKMASRLPGWRVRRMLSLALLSFSNMLLVRDLDPDKWMDESGQSRLLSHPIVRQVFKGREENGGASYAGEHDLDENEEFDFPLIFDADSSQHSAIVDVMQGRTMVIEGPPGTGKSQTITNIIAACINEGKSILFVAEKLAALQVVKSRLDQAKLGPFVLELHSQKTSRKIVLDSLADRMRQTAQRTGEFAALEQNLQDKKIELKRHAKTLRSQEGNALGCSVQEILWRAERPRMRLGDLAERVRNISVEAATDINQRDYKSRKDQIAFLSAQFAVLGGYDERNPFWGFYPESIIPGDEQRIEGVLSAALATATHLAELTGRLSSEYGFVSDGSLDAKGVDAVHSTLKAASIKLVPSAALDVLPRIFSPNADHSDSASRAILDCESRVVRIAEIEGEIGAAIDMDTAILSSVGASELKTVAALGMEGRSFSSFSEAVDEIRKSVLALGAAVGRLAEIAQDYSCRGESDGVAFTRVSALVSSATDCPVDLLHHRSPANFTRNGVEQIQRAIAERSRLELQERALGEVLYLDQLPGVQELRGAILTLREGPAWYRIFQSDWRKAVRLHKSLRRQKVRTPSSIRLDELERVHDLEKAKTAWLESSSVRALAGQAFDGFSTPFDEICRVASWVRDSRSRLASAGVGDEVFNPEDVAPERIRMLRSVGGEVISSISFLTEFDGLVSAHFIDPTRSSFEKNASWVERVAGLRKVSEELDRTRAELHSFVREDHSVAKVFRLVGLAREKNEHEKEIVGSSELSRIFGARSSNYRENIRPVVSALSFGSFVAEAKIPARLKEALWSEMAASVLASLSGQVEAVGGAWAAARSSVADLKKFGDLDQSEWELGDQGSTFGARRTLEKIRRASEHSAGLVPWSQYVDARAASIKLKLGQFVYLLEEDAFPPAALSDAFAFRFHASIAEKLFRRMPELSNFSATRHDKVRAEFQATDKRLIEGRGRQVAANAIRRARPPRGQNGARVDEKTEMNLVELLCSQVRPRVTVRALLQRASNSVRALKPCFMMGPQAVAQFLDAKSDPFDIVIMDEASQLKPEEAIGAIARGSQLVVVGDPKQLPPTSFFSRAQAVDDSQAQMAAVDAESILDVATSHFPPIRSLRWHYRSQHESLIAFSNHSFYRGSLVVFPSPFPRSRALGVRSHYVAEATYDSQMNQLEATRVVDFVVEHIANKPEESLGVVTLNVRQRDLISELLEERLKLLPEADEFRAAWEEKGEPLFVKNLENVQGDERDAIIISTTFGRPPGAARPHQNFGPISQEGGWRRLNVLFTRAKRSILVVTSLRDTDIVVQAQTPRGTKALRDYLLYAATGTLHFDPGVETGEPPGSDFEVAVTNLLSEAGYVCVPQVGVASFRIDIGVRHPDYPHLFLAGIECDGATYHSGVTVRDRDRIRQEILESLGWRGKLWRIWSTQWFRNPREETRRLLSFLDELRRAEVDPAIATMAESASASSEDDVSSHDSSRTIALAESTAQGLISESSEREVGVGDLVAYVDEDSANGRELLVTISERGNDSANGIIGRHTPLAQTLIGAVVGEVVTLQVIGHPDRRFRVVRIGADT